MFGVDGACWYRRRLGIARGVGHARVCAAGVWRCQGATHARRSRGAAPRPPPPPPACAHLVDLRLEVAAQRAQQAAHLVAAEHLAGAAAAARRVVKKPGHLADMLCALGAREAQELCQLRVGGGGRGRHAVKSTVQCHGGERRGARLTVLWTGTDLHGPDPTMCGLLPFVHCW